ncbi:MAG: hypothetical protein HKN21_11880 [Candidatus Eisenbacteria bacterium]|uniref:Uncharacterized protein n=1 Tax=Eiseniibacteriota bacterium TaxID=2212470 RepID=A0A7Y2EFZ6_UNCEI|nr:hypothetical protein [Candidatus Eisenbacteria bacterium]
MARRIRKTPEKIVQGLRTFLILVFTAGTLVTLAELLLLRHTEAFWQLVPVVMLVLSLVMLAWYGLAKSKSSLESFRVVMWAFLLSGVFGFVNHFRANMRFEQELTPGLDGLDLYWRSLQGVNPALAPGTMIFLGLLGLAFCYHHPLLLGKTRK